MLAPAGNSGHLLHHRVAENLGSRSRHQRGPALRGSQCLVHAFPSRRTVSLGLGPLMLSRASRSQFSGRAIRVALWLSP
jgi:hypothetical protein